MIADNIVETFGTVKHLSIRIQDHVFMTEAIVLENPAQTLLVGNN